MERKVRISPSIIATEYNNESKLSSALEMLKESKVALLHLDVMDGKFVSQKTFGPEFINKMQKQTDFLLDTHLMINSPEDYIDDYINAGADILTVHYESTQNLEWCLRKIKSNGLLAGVSIKLDTHIEVLVPYLQSKLIDVILVMSVEPGACGRKFDERALNKIKALRELSPKLDIEVDGGINLDNIKSVVDAGANIIVSGSSIFKSSNPSNVIKEMSSYKCRV